MSPHPIDDDPWPDGLPPGYHRRFPVGLPPKTDPVKEMSLYAWIGEDELGSGVYGIKQARCPAGLIPMVASVDGKVDQDYILRQLQQQSNRFRKSIRLVRFTFAEVITELNPDP